MTDAYIAEETMTTPIDSRFSSEPRPRSSALSDRRGAVSPTLSGWKLIVTAGFVPLVAGFMTIVTTWVNIARGAGLWSTGVGTLGFSYQSLAAIGAGPYVELTGSVGGVNIVGAAVAVIVVARFGLREGQRWAWWFLAFCLVWIGAHDAIMATRFFFATGQPLPLMPLTYSALMLAGLAKSRRALSVRDAEPPRWGGATAPHDSGDTDQ
jgi:hypothetical protein